MGEVTRGELRERGRAFGLQRKAAFIALDLQLVHRLDRLGHSCNRHPVGVFQAHPAHDFPAGVVLDRQLRVEGFVALPQPAHSALALVENLGVGFALVLMRPHEIEVRDCLAWRFFLQPNTLIAR